MQNLSSIKRLVRQIYQQLLEKKKKIIHNISKYTLIKNLKMGFNIEIEDTFGNQSLSK